MWSPRRSTRWRAAAFMTNSRAASIATPWTSTGLSRTLKKCPTTIPSYSRIMSTGISLRAMSFLRLWRRTSSAGWMRCFLTASIAEVAERVKKTPQEVQAILESAKEKMLAARLQRTTPFVDKTVYVGWNELCVSAYLKAARVLKLDDARRFALRSLDRILSQGWDAMLGLQRVLAYSDPQAAKRRVPGVLEDYAFTAIACLDAYEASADLSYFHFAEKIAAAIVARFHDPREGGFFDMAIGPDVGDGLVLGALAARRKPLQDSPTPAGNPMAAIALLRLHAYTNDAKHRDLAEGTLKAFAGIAAHYGL